MIFESIRRLPHNKATPSKLFCVIYSPCCQSEWINKNSQWVAGADWAGPAHWWSQRTLKRYVSRSWQPPCDWPPAVGRRYPAGPAPFSQSPAPIQSRAPIPCGVLARPLASCLFSCDEELVSASVLRQLLSA